LRRYGKNRHITPNISECPGPILTYFTGLASALMGMIFQIFVWQSLKGCCYCNKLNMGDVRKLCVGPPLFFASAFDNGLADRKSAFKRFNGNNQATSCPNVVNFRSVMSEFTLLKLAIFAAIRPQFDDIRQSSFVTLAFRNELEDCNFDFSGVIGNHFCTPSRNVVRFGLVTPEFKT